MKVTHYEDPVTRQVYREIREKSYKALLDLRDEYIKKGKKAILSFDCDWRSDFVLTVSL